MLREVIVQIGVYRAGSCLNRTLVGTLTSDESVSVNHRAPSTHPVTEGPHFLLRGWSDLAGRGDFGNVGTKVMAVTDGSMASPLSGFTPGLVVNMRHVWPV